MKLNSKIIKNSYGEDMYLHQYDEKSGCLMSSQLIYDKKIRHLSENALWFKVFESNVETLEDELIQLIEETSEIENEWIHTHFTEITSKFPQKRGTIYIEVSSDFNDIIIRGRGDFSDIYKIELEKMPRLKEKLKDRLIKR